MSKGKASKRPAAVPQRYAGQWIAWDRARQHILASGKTFDDVYEAVQKMEEKQPIFHHVPKADVWLVGGIA